MNYFIHCQSNYQIAPTHQNLHLHHQLVNHSNYFVDFCLIDTRVLSVKKEPEEVSCGGAWIPSATLRRSVGSWK